MGWNQFKQLRGRLCNQKQTYRDSNTWIGILDIQAGTGSNDHQTKTIERIDWLTIYPDLDLTEHAWNIQLADALVEEWKKNPTR